MVFAGVWYLMLVCQIPTNFDVSSCCISSLRPGSTWLTIKLHTYSPSLPFLLALLSFICFHISTSFFLLLYLSFSPSVSLLVCTPPPPPDYVYLFIYRPLYLSLYHILELLSLSLSLSLTHSISFPPLPTPSPLDLTRDSHLSINSQYILLASIL